MNRTPFTRRMPRGPRAALLRLDALVAQHGRAVAQRYESLRATHNIVRAVAIVEKEIARKK